MTKEQINKAITTATGIDNLDFYSDLNAMHAALKSHTQAFRAEFDWMLHAIAGEKNLLITELEAKDWANGFLFTLELLETHPAPVDAGNKQNER